MDININVLSEKVDFGGNPDAKEILEKVSRFNQQAQAMNLPYWVFVYEAEPIQLYAPP